MKVRNGFVSNSSSSSFIISLEYLSHYQIASIEDYREITNDTDYGWSIQTNDKYLKGSTSMDNFDMEGYLEGLNVDMSKVEWGKGW